MKYLAILSLASGLAAAELPRIFYSKDFPGSKPAYVSVEVDNSGAAVYKEAPDDEQPVKFQLEASETAQIFALAGKLGYFQRKLESGLKVANMGMKTFRFEDGAQKNEVQFNYTQDLDAQLLTDWFERITETAQHAIHLERTARFDRLGVDKALLHLQISFERNRLAGARQLLPILDRIAKNGAFFNRARERAAYIAEAVRAGKTNAQSQE